MEASEEDLSQFETKVLKTRPFSQIQKCLMCPQNIKHPAYCEKRLKCLELFNDYFVGVFGKSEMKFDSTSDPGTLNSK